MPIRINRRAVEQEITRRMKKVESEISAQLAVVHSSLNDDYLLPNLLQAIELIQFCQNLKTDDLYEAVMSNDLDDLAGAVENAEIALRPLTEAVQTIHYILDHAETREDLELELTSDPFDDPS